MALTDVQRDECYEYFMSEVFSRNGRLLAARCKDFKGVLFSTSKKTHRPLNELMRLFAQLGDLTAPAIATYCAWYESFPGKSLQEIEGVLLRKVAAWKAAKAGRTVVHHGAGGDGFFGGAKDDGAGAGELPLFTEEEVMLLKVLEGYKDKNCTFTAAELKIIRELSNIQSGKRVERKTTDEDVKALLLKMLNKRFSEPGISITTDEDRAQFSMLNKLSGDFGSLEAPSRVDAPGRKK